MLKTASASIITLALAVAVPAAHAQFGSGIVFDPTQSTHAYTPCKWRQRRLTPTAQ